MTLTEQFQACVPSYLGRRWTPANGCVGSRVETCEQRLRRRLPESLRALYSSLSEVPELLTAHNRVLPLEHVEVQDGHLVFMEENQSVVSWGIPLMSIGEEDPTAWQRNNTPPVQWFSEEKSVLGLLVAMWDWYVDLGILTKFP
ncbi:MAG: hypothetical protein KIT72_08485 [Polyangiaceae bacterium]|nr:hypothetical protein [Polyangiaceae bacterium]